MVEFTPQTAPPIAGNPDLTQLSQWAQRELARLSQQLTNSDLSQYNVQFVAPDRPREGMTVVADGTRWNPGAGAGFYLYQGGAWKKLLDAASADALFLTPVEGNALFLTQAEADALYAPLTAPPSPPAAFHAHKNGTAQTVATGTPTTVTWPTAAYDVGSHFSTSTSLWTPPAGKVFLTAGAICTPLPPITYSFTGANFQFWAIYKNGALFKQTASYEQANSNGTVFSITAEDSANGSDTYGITATFTLTGASAQIQGSASNTWFQGHWISA